MITSPSQFRLSFWNVCRNTARVNAIYLDRQFAGCLGVILAVKPLCRAKRTNLDLPDGSIKNQPYRLVVLRVNEENAIKVGISDP